MLVFLVALNAVLSTVRSQESLPIAGCGTTSYQRSGILSVTSTSNSCQWRIITQQSEKIILNITELDIVKAPDCSLGSLEVRDGLWDTSPLLGRFCGFGSVTPIISTGNKIFVSYSKQDQNRHFLATYESICGGSLFVQTTTTLKSHESGLYPHNKKCIWFVVVPDGYLVRLDFLKFNLEYHQNCLYDYVEIFDGVRLNSTAVGKFCGTEVVPVVSTSNTLRIAFVTDSSVSDEGFELRITPEIDRCAYGNDGCAQICSNTDSGSECSCRDGYELLSDGRSCGVVCGGSLNATSGFITSPFFPQNYPPNARCIWEIVAPVGNVISLYVYQFDLDTQWDQECVKDKLEVFSVIGSNGTISHGNFCFNNIPMIQSESNILKLVFSSDDNIEGTGFSIHYAYFPRACGTFNGNCHHQCVPSDQGHQCVCQDNYTLQANNLDCKLDLCQYELSAPSGIINSVNYPNFYNNNLNCTWSFKTTPGHRIAINFTNFNLENHVNCGFDYVNLFDGSSTHSDNLVQLCGNRNATLVVSNSSEMYMVFRTDASNVASGFLANYSSVCGGNFTAGPEEKYIYSHDQYLVSEYYNGTDCTWNILPTPGYNTKLNFENFEVERCYDYVEIYSGTQYHGKFCGTNEPKQTYVSSYTIKIRFRSDNTISRKGFQIKYQAV